VGADDGLFGGRYEAVETLNGDPAFQTFRAIDRQHGRQVWLGVQRAVELSRESLVRAKELGVDEVATLAAKDLADSERRAAEERDNQSDTEAAG
jgi:hypothetical protein